jgi:hypothetical protein
VHDDDISSAPPESLAAFHAVAEATERREHVLTTRYRLTCRNCAGEVFGLREFLVVDGGAIAVEADCVQCGRSASVFDALRDGYDGRLGHLEFLESHERFPAPCADGGTPLKPAAIACEFSYSIELEELASTEAEEGVAARDLFDWVSILVRDPRGDDWRHVWGYECA